MVAFVGFGMTSEGIPHCRSSVVLRADMPIFLRCGEAYTAIVERLAAQRREPALATFSALMGEPALIEQLKPVPAG